MIKTIKRKYFKFLLKRNYLKLLQKDIEFKADCGASLAGMTSLDLSDQAKKVVKILENLRKIDENCPETPSWILKCCDSYV